MTDPNLRDTSGAPRRWILRNGIGTLVAQAGSPIALGESVEVMPVSEHEERLATIRAELPKVYDGTHLVDCPYIDVLMRISALLGPEPVNPQEDER